MTILEYQATKIVIISISRVNNIQEYETQKFASVKTFENLKHELNCLQYQIMSL